MIKHECLPTGKNNAGINFLLSPSSRWQWAWFCSFRMMLCLPVLSIIKISNSLYHLWSDFEVVNKVFPHQISSLINSPVSMERNNLLYYSLCLNLLSLFILKLQQSQAWLMGTSLSRRFLLLAYSGHHWTHWTVFDFWHNKMPQTHSVLSLAQPWISWLFKGHISFLLEYLS